MQLECLPCDERGRPHAAAQDMNGYVWATLLPVTGFPLLLGRSVSWFPVRNDATRCTQNSFLLFPELLLTSTPTSVHVCVRARG